MPELVLKRAGQMTAATVDALWNRKRSEITYRIGKQGVSAFLLLGTDDLAAPRTMIDLAAPGHTA
jgi:hypothetical protein